MTDVRDWHYFSRINALILRISTYFYVKRKKVNAELFPDICRNDLIEVNCFSSAWNRLLPFIFQEVWSVILILHLISKVVPTLVLIYLLVSQ